MDQSLEQIHVTKEITDDVDFYAKSGEKQEKILYKHLKEWSCVHLN